MWGMVHVVPRDPGYQPHMHKGALKQVSPEEITAARDVETLYIYMYMYICICIYVYVYIHIDCIM